MPDAHASASAKRARLKRLRILLASGYLMIAALLIGWEMKESHLLKVDTCELRTGQSVEDPLSAIVYNSAYAPVMRMTKRKESQDVVIVSIESGLERIQANVCPARGLMADLLLAIANQHAKVIAIDKFYGADSCAPDDAGTQALISAIASLQVPVVVGASTHNSKQNNASSCLVLNPQLFAPIPHTFGLKGAAGPAVVYTGLTRLNENPLKVPLTWPLFLKDGDNNVAKNGAGDSLSLVATRLEVSDQTNTDTFQRLERLSNSPQQPYADITGSLDRQTATNLLCTADPHLAADAPQWGIHCEDKSKVMSQHNLAGKVVVIGAESSTDYWPVPVGEMYGFELQAHYIAALLGGAYLQDIPIWVLLAALVVYYSVSELMLPYLGRHERPIAGLPQIKHPQFWDVGLFCVTMLIGFFVPLMYRRFPPLTLLLAVATLFITRTLIEWWAGLNEKMEDIEKELSS